MKLKTANEKHKELGWSLDLNLLKKVAEKANENSIELEKVTLEQVENVLLAFDKVSE